MTEEEYRIRRVEILRKLDELIQKHPDLGKKEIETKDEWEEAFAALQELSSTLGELQDLKDAYDLGVSLDELEHDTSVAYDDIAYEDQL